MIYVIFHGSFGEAEGNWFPELKERLERLNQKVILKQFPIENWDELSSKGVKAFVKSQTLENWLVYFKKEILPVLGKKEKLCFIGHSIAPLFILHILENYNITLDCAVFVSPFFRRLTRETIPWQYKKVNESFYKTDFDFVKLKKRLN
jgi:predicted alpha/beta hydrolase family esterase